MSIESFRHKGLKELFEKRRSARVGARYAAKALEIMDYLDSIAESRDCLGVQDFHELNVQNLDFVDYH